MELQLLLVSHDDVFKLRTGGKHPEQLYLGQHGLQQLVVRCHGLEAAVEVTGNAPQFRHKDVSRSPVVFHKIVFVQQRTGAVYKINSSLFQNGIFVILHHS